jgi:hypothetical protein
MAPYYIKFFCEKEHCYRSRCRENGDIEYYEVEISIVEYFSHLTNMTSIIFSGGKVYFGKIFNGDAHENGTTCALHIYPVTSMCVREFGKYGRGRKIDYTFSETPVVLQCEMEAIVYSTHDSKFKTYVEDSEYSYGGRIYNILRETCFIFNKYLHDNNCSRKMFIHEIEHSYQIISSTSKSFNFKNSSMYSNKLEIKDIKIAI